MSWDTCFEGSSWGLPAREGLGVVGFSVRVLGRWVDVGVLRGCCR